MITILDPAACEAGLKAYLDARFEAESLAMPVPGAGGTPQSRQPAVVVGLSTEIPEISEITVCLRKLPGADTDVVGWYAPELLVTVVTPLGIAGLDITHHSAVYAAVAAAFPARPGPGASDEEKGEWALLHYELDEALQAAAGYRARGWHAAPSVYAKRGDRVEQPIVVRIGAIHEDLVAGED